MNDIMTYYLCAVNVLAFILYGIDKEKAKRGKWRIPEATLIGAAVIGGSAGAWLGMKTFHHKTKHRKFAVGVPVILVVQAVILMYLYF